MPARWIRASSSSSTTTTCRSRRRSARCRPIWRGWSPGGPTGRCAHVVHQLAKRLPKFLEQRARAMEEYARGLVTGGTLFEELGFFYVGPIDGHNLDHLLPVLRNVRDAKDGPILVHVVTQKGKGYAPAEASHGQVSRRGQVRRRHRQAGQGQGERAVLHQGVRREPGEGGQEGRPHRRDHGGDAVRHRRRHLRQGISGAHLRRRHRRAAWRDVRGRPRDRRLQAVRRDLFDLPAARLRPDRARRRDPAAAGALRARSRGARRRRRADPRRRVRSAVSRLPARLRADGGGRRGRACPHGGDRGRDRRPAERACAIRAATASASTCPNSACRSRSARAASCAKAARWRCSRSARGWRNACSRPRRWRRTG